MSRVLVSFLAARAPRERWLIGALVLGVLPLAVWFGALVPMSEARDAAKAQLERTTALGTWVAARSAEAEAQRARPRQGAQSAPPPIGLPGIEQSLTDARLHIYLRDVSGQSDGAVSVRFADVPFVDLARWLGNSELTWGYDIATLQIERTQASGLVQAMLMLVPADNEAAE